MKYSKSLKVSQLKCPGQDGLNLKEQIIPILLKFFHMIETERTVPNSFYEATVTLIPKPHKDTTKGIMYQSSSWTLMQ